MAPPKRVLVVEDDDHIRHLLIEYLKEHSHLAVDGAHDGADALHQVLSARYPVVILDLMMPFMTGIDFLDSLEAMQADPSVKPIGYQPAVIVITSAARDQVADEELEQRFPSMVRAVLRKPLEPERLEALVAELLA
jgi:CheY-like chemotaxis protein